MTTSIPRNPKTHRFSHPNKLHTDTRFPACRRNRCVYPPHGVLSTCPRHGYQSVVCSGAPKRRTMDNPTFSQVSIYSLRKFPHLINPMSWRWMEDDWWCFLFILRSDVQVPIWVPVSIEDSYEREKQIQQKKRVKKYIWRQAVGW